MSVEPDVRTLSPRRLTDADVPNGFALSSAAGWNQLENDWMLMIRMGQGLGLGDPDDILVGTAILLPFQNRADWVSMVLVNEPWRRRGVGTRLMRLVIELSMNPVLGLDATDLGVPVYEGLGFHAAERITRYGRNPMEDAGGGGGYEASCRPVGHQEFREMVIPFTSESARSRRQLLEMLDPTGVGMMRMAREDKTVALLSSRPGRESVQIGPLFASDAASATALLRARCGQSSESLIIDVPDRHDAFANQVRRLGFEPFRHFTRMYRGGMPRPNPNEYAVAGPEFG